MKKYFVLISMVIVVITGIILAQKPTISIASRWERITEFASKQLPESALKEVDQILIQAQKEKNSAQIIKAMIYKMRFIMEKEPEKASRLIIELEAFTEKSKVSTEKAILYSMTAELYAKYYQNDQWNINRRTQVVGVKMDDLKEWTKNIFYDKISYLLDASLQNTDELQKTDALKYEELVEKGKDSRKLQPTLFDFLANRQIDILNEIAYANDTKNPLSSDKYFSNANEFISLKTDSLFVNSTENQIIETYQQLIAFHQSVNNTEALIYADLNRLKYVKNITGNNELYLKAISTLEEKYKKNESIVEALVEKANYYLQKNYETNDKENNNSTFKKVAYNICTDGINRFPKYKRIELLRNIQNQITQKSLNVNHNELVKPASNLEIKINSANIPSIQINVYKVNSTALEYFNFKQNRQNRNQIYPQRSLLETKEMSIKTDPNFGVVDTVLNLKTKEYGIYEISVETKGNTDKEKVSTTVFIVSDFGFIQRATVANLQSFYVLDRQSGLQQAGVQVSVYEPKWTGSSYKYELKSKIKTDNNGMCLIPFNTNYYETKVFVERENDKFFSSVSYANFYNYFTSINETPQVKLFTDRTLYRPGQTVYFKGIAYYANKNRNEVDKTSTYEITLYDVNNQKVSSKSVSTNNFGSFVGNFVLPSEGLNGAFRLETTGCSQTIYVEEYKRPTFEVTIEKPKTEIRFGEKVRINGNVKAFAGYAVGNAKVKYSINRATHRYCWWWGEPATEITNGTAISDVDGKFEITFIPVRPINGSNSWRGNFYTYTISADVTDSKGETQQGEHSFSIGDKSLFIIAKIADKIEKKSIPKLEIYTETLNGEKINSIIDYDVYRLEELSDYVENNTEKTIAKTTEKVASGKFNTTDKYLSLEMKKWKSAQYKLVMTTKDALGNEVKTENIFVVYDDDDKRPPIKSYVWMLSPVTSCKIGEKAQIRFGTSTKNTSVLYEILLGNKILESKWIKFNDEIKIFDIPYEEEYGAGINVQFTFMKDEKFFSQQVNITRKPDEKKLTPTLNVFRNKLQPGEKAEWTITIPETEKNRKTAELLVGMYDASLDAIRPHSWNFYPYYNESIMYSPVWSVNTFNQSNDNVYFDNQAKEIPNYNFDYLNWFGFSLSNRYGGNIRVRGSRSVQVMEDNVFEMASETSVSGLKIESTSSENIKLESKIVTTDSKSDAVQINEKPVKPRTNFNETAFFYPQLQTDAEGNVKFKFTAPESLTRWNLKMLAHTPDLFYGQNEAQVVTQKDLMVQMNLPRFVRRSDKLVLSANLINLTEKELKASITFELIDPSTEKIFFTQIKQVSLSPGTDVVEFEISNFSSIELVICKMVASAGNFSDGEQKYLPVLPDKILVTESMPLTIRANQTRIFNFASLLKNVSKVETQNLAIEFSSNPAWYAVQALPTLSTPENDNALDYFTAYYANSLASFIANSNPKIAKIFDQWKNARSSRDALISNLQKNAELKNMLLDETPWVMAAKDETEQKRQIALLFDLNMQKNQSQQYLDKLLKLQTSNGGFAWFEGMPESRYITQEIILNLARLNKMTGQQTVSENQQTAIKNALYYLDMEISKDLAELKKHNKNYQKENYIGNMQLFYLHMRSYYPEIPIHVAAHEAVKFYTVQSEKYWTSFTLYGKAMMAVVACRNGKIQIANDILKSLRENALKTDEFGMYWAKNAAGYFWSERPIAVQAAIIEAFTEVDKNIAEIDELKIWLLKQKQTQRWDSPSATVNAIYALLLKGSDWLANEGNVKIKIGAKVLNPATNEAGTGYFKVSIPVAEIRPTMGKVTVSTAIGSATLSHTPNSGSIGWGAMYWQFYQELDKIEAQGTSLKIIKKLFVEVNTASGKSMLPIEQTQLKKGEKVITRLVIINDRNLEFVALKDLRASCFEPVDQRSGSQWKENVCYYQSTKDASTQFFFSYLPKGTYVFEYELWVNNSGSFTSGITSVQCQYAPEFVSHSGGEKIIVK